MHLISTDLPVPEPPMTTRLSPGAQSRSMPSSTRLRPNDLRSPRTAIFGAAAAVISVGGAGGKLIGQTSAWVIA